MRKMRYLRGFLDDIIQLWKAEIKDYISIEKHNLLDCSCMEMFGYCFTKQLVGVCSRFKFMGLSRACSEAEFFHDNRSYSLGFYKNWTKIKHLRDAVTRAYTRASLRVIRNQSCR